MEILINIWTIGFLLFVLVIVMDTYVISKLSEDNKLKKWWKRHIIDDAPQDMDI